MAKYKVNISVSVCIEADSEEQAWKNATAHIVDGLDTDDVDAAFIKADKTELVN